MTLVANIATGPISQGQWSHGEQVTCDFWYRFHHPCQSALLFLNYLIQCSAAASHKGILSDFWFTESRQSFWPWVQSREICELIQEHLERTLPLEPQTLWKRRKSRMRKAIDNCFEKIHHCMTAKMKLQNYGHLAFWAPLLRGLRCCSQRPRHNQDSTFPIWK